MRLSNSETKYLRSLAQKKFRQAEHKFLLEGWRALKEVLNSPFHVEFVAVIPKHRSSTDYEKILSEIERRKIPVKEVSESDLQKIAETVHSQGVVALVHQRTMKLEGRSLRKMSLIVAADNVSDPGNLGSILRTVDWFGVELLLLSKQCVELYNEKVIRSTVGSIFHVSVVERVDLPSTLADLKNRGFFVASLSADGKQSYVETRLNGKHVLVVGSEAHGVSPEVRKVSDAIVRIPKYGQAESLNVGVACGVVLAHLKASRSG